MRPELLAYLTSLARTLLAALDAHEDATEGREIADGVHADAYHPDHADAVYEAKSALRSVLTPGEDPAPRGAGAPDAAGGALGVGSACTYSRAWIGPCGKPGDHGRCPEHALVVCSCCGAPATGECPQTGGLVCGSPLCDNCEHDPKPGWHCAHHRKPGASGVGAGLTNCDNCAHDYGYFEGFGREVRGCRRLDNDEGDYDAINDWSTRWCSTRRDARPDAGATGCPGWAKRGEG